MYTAKEVTELIPLMRGSDRLELDGCGEVFTRHAIKEEQKEWGENSLKRYNFNNFPFYLFQDDCLVKGFDKTEITKVIREFYKNIRNF